MIEEKLCVRQTMRVAARWRLNLQRITANPCDIEGEQRTIVRMYDVGMLSKLLRQHLLLRR